MVCLATAPLCVQELSRGVDAPATAFGTVFLTRGFAYLVGTLAFGKALHKFDMHAHRIVAVRARARGWGWGGCG